MYGLNLQGWDRFGLSDSEYRVFIKLHFGVTPWPSLWGFVLSEGWGDCKGDWARSVVLLGASVSKGSRAAFDWSTIRVLALSSLEDSGMSCVDV